VYQNRKLFKHNYPFSAPENRNPSQVYKKGICPNTERLHYKEMIINEHVRYPHDMTDINDLVRCFEKVTGGMK